MKRKIFVIMIILIINCFIVSNCGYCSSISKIQKTMTGVTNVTGGGDVKTMINTIIGVFQAFGTAILVAAVLMLGIKYMLASSQDKADLKKQAVPILTGCILLFAATTIAKIIADIGSSLN